MIYQTEPCSLDVQQIDDSDAYETIMFILSPWRSALTPTVMIGGLSRLNPYGQPAVAHPFSQHDGHEIRWL